jgi:nucleotide-binding universal stress UspA family protein
MFKDVLIAIDLAEPGSWARALPVAVQICKDWSARLHVVTVAAEVNMQVASFFPGDANERLLEQTATELQNWIREHVTAGIEVHRLVGQGSIHREIIAAATEYGLHITEKALSLSDLYNADEIWLSNAMVELLPVSSIDGIAVNRGARWREILSLYKQRTET